MKVQNLNIPSFSNITSSTENGSRLSSWFISKFHNTRGTNSSNRENDSDKITTKFSNSDVTTIYASTNTKINNEKESGQTKQGMAESLVKNVIKAALNKIGKIIFMFVVF
jgi:hypothetical protein